MQFIDIFNDDASLNNYGLHHKGKDRFKARKDIIVELDKLGILEKQEEITHNVGISERTNEIIEPKFSYQWFLKMNDLVKPAINSVLVDNEINFNASGEFPKDLLIFLLCLSRTIPVK